ncbi:MAG: hypothetical protein [Bacteriophage sp.]|nr:MAG: hypothetical protein [Bacteriophage sp.]
MPTALEEAYGVVSVEMSNPFPSMSQYSLNKFKQFSTFTSGFVQNIFTKNTDDLPKNLAFKSSGAVERAFQNKEVMFSDIQPVIVYVPSILKPNAYVLDYAHSLNVDMKIAQDSLMSAPEQLVDIIQTYISNPARLQDPMLIYPQVASGLSLLDLNTRIQKQKKENEKLITSTGATTQRQFSKAFRRIGDYTQCMKLANELHQSYLNAVNEMPKFIMRTKEANRKIDELMTCLQNNPAVYKMSGYVAEHLTKQMYYLAAIAEYFAATLYHTQVYVKAMVDTTQGLERSVTK